MPLQTGSHLFRQYFCVISSALLALMQPRIITRPAPCFTVRIMHSLWWQSLHQICRTNSFWSHLTKECAPMWHQVSAETVFLVTNLPRFFFICEVSDFQIYFFPCKVMRQTCIYTRPIRPKLRKFWWSKVILYMCLYKMFSVYIITLIGNPRSFSFALTITGFLTCLSMITDVFTFVALNFHFEAHIINIFSLKYYWKMIQFFKICSLSDIAQERIHFCYILF